MLSWAIILSGVAAFAFALYAREAWASRLASQGSRRAALVVASVCTKVHYRHFGDRFRLETTFQANGETLRRSRIYNSEAGASVDFSRLAKGTVHDIVVHPMRPGQAIFPGEMTPGNDKLAIGIACLLALGALLLSHYFGN